MASLEKLPITAEDIITPYELDAEEPSTVLVAANNTVLVNRSLSHHMRMVLTLKPYSIRIYDNPLNQPTITADTLTADRGLAINAFLMRYPSFFVPIYNNRPNPNLSLSQTVSLVREHKAGEYLLDVNGVEGLFVGQYIQFNIASKVYQIAAIYEGLSQIDLAKPLRYNYNNGATIRTSGTLYNNEDFNGVMAAFTNKDFGLPVQVTEDGVLMQIGPLELLEDVGLLSGTKAGGAYLGVSVPAINPPPPPLPGEGDDPSDPCLDYACFAFGNVFQDGQFAQFVYAETPAFDDVFPANAGNFKVYANGTDFAVGNQLYIQNMDTIKPCGVELPHKKVLLNASGQNLYAGVGDPSSTELFYETGDQTAQINFGMIAKRSDNRLPLTDIFSVPIKSSWTETGGFVRTGYITAVGLYIDPNGLSEFRFRLIRPGPLPALYSPWYPNPSLGSGIDSWWGLTVNIDLSIGLVNNPNNINQIIPAIIYNTYICSVAHFDPVNGNIVTNSHSFSSVAAPLDTYNNPENIVGNSWQFDAPDTHPTIMGNLAYIAAIGNSINASDLLLGWRRNHAEYTTPSFC